MNRTAPSLLNRDPPFATVELGRSGFGLRVLALFTAFACGAIVRAEPVGGAVAAGAAVIGGTSTHTVVTQTTPLTVINWQSFGIGAGESVRFVQPGTSAVALNRVVGAEPSRIFGSLSANGNVFLVNPHGVLFGPNASVNVGGLVASALSISDTDFLARNFVFSPGAGGSVVNRGTITASQGGYVALLGAAVSNQGVITARLGTVALVGGEAMTLDMAGDRLLGVAIDRAALNALVDNGGAIRADGGLVLMTTHAAGSLLANAVNNTGIVQAQTIENVSGTIKLMGGMHDGTVGVAGILDASAPAGGKGGFVETSAAVVKIADGVKIDTSASRGAAGQWLIDPQDFTVGGNATDNISGATLSALLVTNSVTISTLMTGPDVTTAGTPPLTSVNSASAGNGDIFINQAVSWSASSSPTTLTLNAVRDVNINAPIVATNGNLATCCGRDVNVRAPITTTNGSILLNAGRTINMDAAMTTTDGNIAMCAAQNVNIAAKLTLTRGSTTPGQSLDLPPGLLLLGGYGVNDPAVGSGTVVFAPLAPAMTVTGPDAPVTVLYNPASYQAPTDYSNRFIFSGGAALTQKMLVFAEGADKTFDGTTAATLSSLRGNPNSVVLVAGPGSSASFDSAGVGTGKLVTFSGYELGGSDAASYALASSCCTPTVNATRATIAPAPVPTPASPVPTSPPAPFPTPAPTPASVIPPASAPMPTPGSVTAPVPVTPGVTPVVGGIPVVISPVAGPVPVVAPTLVLLDPVPLNSVLLAGRPSTLQGTGLLSDVAGRATPLSNGRFPVTLNVVESELPPDVKQIAQTETASVMPARPAVVQATKPRPYVAPVYPRKQDRH
jgi:filamentous hemagglutinin family protein